ncbi:MAG: hypothetical protein WBD63_06890 [Phycisphaerae bacterium]|nr:hypothetical protein [Phycisphaerae bacterium]
MSIREEDATSHKKSSVWVWLALGACLLLLLGALSYYFLTFPVYTGPHNPIQNTIKCLEAGLAGFRADFGDYPPSDKDHSAAYPFGYQNLAFYLCGPEGKGWGGPAGGAMPFGGKSEKTFGPYFEGESSGLGKDLAEGVSDSFRPPMPILYFRAEPTEDPVFDAADNPLDPTGRKGFASQEHFERLARRADGQWVRTDYLLISAGLDRRFGYAVQDAESGLSRPARPDEKEKAWCDDVTNFVH